MGIDFERAPSWRRYLRFWGSNPNADVEEELKFHLESRVAELVAAGYSEEEARRLANTRFGDMDSIRAHCQQLNAQRTRSISRAEWRGDLWQDLRYGWRTLVRTPAFTLTAVLSLALGIGANAAMFSLLHAVLLARLPLPHPEQLITLQRIGQRMIDNTFTYEEYSALSGAGVALTVHTGRGIDIGAPPDRAREPVEFAAGNYFALLGVSAQQGRLLNEEDVRAAAPVVVISEQYWRTKLNSDPQVIGRSLLLNGIPFRIVGVTQASYQGTMFAGSFRAAVPLTVSPLLGKEDLLSSRDAALVITGRRSKEQNFERAQAMLSATFAACCRTASQQSGSQIKGGGSGKPGAAKPSAGSVPPGTGPRFAIADMSRGLNSPKFDVRAQYGTLLYILMAGVLVLLVIACANVGTLLLARAAARSRELAIRMSLGAARARVVRQLLTESLQLAVCGATLGLLFAWWGMALLSRYVPEQFVFLSELVRLQPDRTVLGFTLLTTLVCSVIFGVFPALRATRVDLSAPMKEADPRQGGQRTRFIDRALVSLQVALALLLITGAGLLVQTLHNLRTLDGGFEPSRLLLANVDTRATQYEPQGIVPLHDDILRRLRALPGVRAAAMSTMAPVFRGGSIWMSTINVPGYVAAQEEHITFLLAGVSPGYFEASGIELRAGRDFGPGDTENSQPVAIISEEAVRRYFANRNPIGASLQNGETALRIVGVAANARYRDLRAPENPMMYRPVLQSGNQRGMVLVVRTEGDPVALTAAVRSALAASAPGIEAINMQDITEAVNVGLSRERFAAMLATLFGLMALGLAAMGLYGVMAFYVTRRTTEIGTRLALGAGRANVLWLVLRQSLLMLLAGFVIGLPLTLWAARSVAAQLYGVRVFDPLTLGSGLIVLTLVTVLASVLPARRATRVDPLMSLRAY